MKYELKQAVTIAASGEQGEVIGRAEYAKAEQAENLIEFQGAMRQPGSKGLSDDEWSLREAHYTKSQHLNQRGIAA